MQFAHEILSRVKHQRVISCVIYVKINVIFMISPLFFFVSGSGKFNELTFGGKHKFQLIFIATANKRMDIYDGF